MVNVPVCRVCPVGTRTHPPDVLLMNTVGSTIALVNVWFCVPCTTIVTPAP